MDKEFNSTKSLEKVSKTTCYMCACRCGIDVHLKDNEVIHIEGNRDHPVNKGVLCAKGASGIFQHKAASRLKKPLRRVGERGEGKFEEISWEEALGIAVKWLSPIRKKSPEKLTDKYSLNDKLSRMLATEKLIKNTSSKQVKQSRYDPNNP